MPTIEAEMNHPDRILAKAEIASWIGVSTSTIDRWAAAGHFPKKVQLGPSRVGWPRSAVQAWLAER